MTKKDGFHWNQEANAAFEVLKGAITSASILVYPDFSLPFELECDASGRGVVQMQQWRSVAYFSKPLSGVNLLKSTYEKELMAVVLVVEHWRHYLLGRKFTIFTDQKSLIPHGATIYNFCSTGMDGQVVRILV